MNRLTMSSRLACCRLEYVLLAIAASRILDRSNSPSRALVPPTSAAKITDFAHPTTVTVTFRRSIRTYHPIPSADTQEQ
jgi:hypothetical protein